MNLTWKHFAPVASGDHHCATAGARKDCRNMLGTSSRYSPGYYWRLGAIFGVIFFAVFTVISLSWVLARG